MQFGGLQAEIHRRRFMVIFQANILGKTMFLCLFIYPCHSVDADHQCYSNTVCMTMIAAASLHAVMLSLMATLIRSHVRSCPVCVVTTVTPLLHS